MSRNLSDVDRDLTALGRGGMRKIVRGILVRGALLGEAMAKAETYPGSGLKVRTGRLRGSIGGTVRDKGEATELVLSAGGSGNRKDVRYAGVHEGLDGSGRRVSSTTILPKNGRYLRIPMSAARTAAGVDRFPGRLREVAPGLFTVAMTRDRKLVLVRTDSAMKGRKGGKREAPWYTLVSSVTVPARPFLKPAMDRLRPEVIKALLGGLADAAHGRTGGG